MTTTLYDVLGARPDDDAENLKKAYRKAAMANHPDRHAGDPGAAVRFRRINAAYDVLRDAGHREAYDRMLQTGREALRTTLKQAASRRRRSIVSHAIACAVAMIMLAGGVVLYSWLTGVSIGDITRLATRRPANIAAVQPVGQAAPQMPIMVVPDTPRTLASATNGDESTPAKAEPPEVRSGSGTM